ncbi:MAG: CHAT domain-containing protein [Spirosoma sp.]|nr:CHAT domain-containing protein [Spirosoma sp.]
MDTLLFCYANNRDRPLSELGNEDSQIDRLLDPRSSKNQFQKVRDSFATTDSVSAKILTYRDTLCLFHFSGHAGSNVLLLEDTPALGIGMAQLLARCPNLRLVFLNGCSTLNHIKLLADQHVNAAVIATTTPVEDAVATRFSTTFYRALVNQYSVQQSLDQARLSMQISSATVLSPISRGGLETATEVSLNQWYVYYPDDQTARWELPTGMTTDATAYVPNSILRRSLFESLRACDPTLTQLFKTKQSLPTDGLRDWLHEEELRRLPFPISESLRKLLCPQISPESKPTQPTATRDRLENYVTLFDASVDLLMSILLAQTRTWLQTATPRQRDELDTRTKQLLQETITSGWAGWGVDQLTSAVQTLRTFFNQQKISLFMPELANWLDLFGTDAKLADTLTFMFTLRARLAHPNGVGSVPALCQLGEEHLSAWLDAAGCWASYRLESFKNIRAVRLYQQTPQYRHEMVVLRTSQNYRTDETYFQEVQLTDLWDCQSVLLVRIQRRLAESGPVETLVADGFLNLAPFVIDRNVFLKSDNTVFDLYSFHAHESGQLRYRHISRPNDLLLTIGPDDSDLLGKQDYSLLRGQIDSLRSLLSIDPDALPLSATLSTNDIDIDALSRI